MFYWLYTYLDINIFQYITVRAGLGLLFSFLITTTLLPFFIKFIKSKNCSQPIYEYAPKTHKIKKGTPTMGGLVFIICTIICTLLTARLDNTYVLLGILLITISCLIGVKDDLSKIFNNRNDKGLRPRVKFTLQIITSLIIAAILYYYNHSTLLYIPFYKHALFDMSYYSIIFWSLVIVSVSNSVNLTDGLDGLATVPSIFSLFTLCIIIYITGHFIVSDYLLLPYVKDSGELIILASCMIGSLIAFLWYNSHPAEVFMGDSGSLAIGSLIGYIGIVCKSEVLLFIIGFVFVIETISVILQVLSFKLRKKRIFLMAPIHHHFEEKGWKENKIIIRFWIMAFLSNLIALFSLKFR